jgi:hypothetical protein
MEQINKYHNGKIYKITSANTSNIYVGSTILALNRRLTNHLCDYKKWLNNMLIKNISSFDIIKMNDYKIELIEAYKCENKKELETRERYYIELYKDIVLNKKIPTRTKKEYGNDNKNKISEQKKEYYENNKDKINELRTQYYENNKDKINESRTQYYKNNKDKILEKIKCICGSEIVKCSKLRHEQSKKHIDLLKKK